jgi:hypothetical protein
MSSVSLQFKARQMTVLAKNGHSRRADPLLLGAYVAFATLRFYFSSTPMIIILRTNPRHPGLQTHQYHSITGPGGEKIFETCAEQNTPTTYRIFFYYGKERGDIIVFAITEQP